jgi:hypothetical protein
MTAAIGDPLGVRPPRCVQALGLIRRPLLRLSGLADIPDFTESDSTGLDWFESPSPWAWPCRRRLCQRLVPVASGPR